MSGPVVIARCHPALVDHLPPPLPAADALPPWVRTSPGKLASELLGGAELRTLKHCPPFLDALRTGLLLRLACAITATEDGLVWDWQVPVPDDLGIPASPLGLHLPDQLTGTPLKPRPDQPIVKFLNHWTLEAPAGCSLLVTHPFGREDLPFRTLTGVVDADRFALGHIHAPALWLDPAWRGTLEVGTPYAQVLVVARASSRPMVEARAWTEEEAAGRDQVLEDLRRSPGGYRKSYRVGSGDAGPEVDPEVDEPED
ncbi:MAG: hypothetical protein H6843_02755 [Rhodospirillaceae bacterium]|nr:hypothetical protein [Rhodospirillaceae bacterium]